MPHSIAGILAKIPSRSTKWGGSGRGTKENEASESVQVWRYQIIMKYNNGINSSTCTCINNHILGFHHHAWIDKINQHAAEDLPLPKPPRWQSSVNRSDSLSTAPLKTI